MVQYIKKNYLAKDLINFGNVRILGKEDREFSNIANIEDIKDNSLVYISDIKFLQKVICSNASVIIAPYNLKDEIEKILYDNIEKTFILFENPKLLFAYLTSFFKKREIKASIDSTVISKSKINENEVQIEPYVVIGENVEIGKNVFLGSFVNIGDNCKIGDGTVIFSGVKLYENIEIGKNCIIHSNTVIGADGFGYVFDGKKHVKIEHLGKIIIEDDVEIGANCCIDRATIGETIIKKGTKIDNLVQIAHNVKIGENSIICAQVGIAGGAIIGNNVILAGQVGISDHAILDDNIIAGAQAGLTPKKYEKNSFLLGTPAMEAVSFKKSIVLFSKLPEIYKKVCDIEKILKELEGKIEFFNNKDNTNE